MLGTVDVVCPRCGHAFRTHDGAFGTCCPRCHAVFDKHRHAR